MSASFLGAMATRAADILGGCATANAARSNASLGLLPHETLQRILALLGSQQALARASRVDHLFCALVRQLGDDALAEQFGRPVPSLSHRAVALTLDMRGAFDNSAGLMTLPSAQAARSLFAVGLLSPRALEDLVAGGCASYEQMGLSAALLRSASENGLHDPPTWLHQRLIGLVGARRDALVHTPWGHESISGTAVALLQAIDPSLSACQAIVLEPTYCHSVNAWGVYRSLAAGCSAGSQLSRLGQLSDEVRSGYISYNENGEAGAETHVRLNAAPDVAHPLNALDAGVQIMCSTPGRMLSAILRGELALDQLRFVVAEPLDELLLRGFRDSLADLLELVPPGAHRLFFYDGGIADGCLTFARDFLRAPALLVHPRPTHEVTLDGVKQFYVMVEREEWKLDTLCDLYEMLTITQAMIFVNTRRKVEWLTEKMHARNFTCSAIHADLDQKEREVIMRELRSGSSRVLITTDVLARGFDAQQLSLVINYDLPTNRENYIHRIGRCGRFGRKSVAINFLTSEDVQMLREIEQFYNTQIEEMPMNVADLI